MRLSSALLLVDQARMAAPDPSILCESRPAQQEQSRPRPAFCIPSSLLVFDGQLNAALLAECPVHRLDI